jgi:hypothetical protein
LLIALSAMSHVVVAMVIALFAVLIFLTRRPRRTWRLALPVGAVAVAITAVWSFPLIARNNMTQSMRYEKVIPAGNWKLPTWIGWPTWAEVPNWFPAHAALERFFGHFGDALGVVRRTIEGVVRGIGTASVNGTATKQPLWLPWWIWLLAGIAVVAACYYRRRSTLVLFIAALALGVMFVQWPEHAVWNTRFLPFWLLTWGFLAAMGATELLILAAAVSRWAVRWVREGDAHDARAHAWMDLAASDGPHAELARVVVATRDWDKTPPGWDAPAALQHDQVERRARRVSVVVMAVLVTITGVWTINRAWGARDDNPQIAISSWASWNYSGYESKPAWKEYSAIIDTMKQLPPGRALWEPSSLPGGQDPINSYGTSLALELLPYWTNGRIGSMEGLYFESSATTSFHFLTVSEVAAHPSNPVRGLDYGTLEDFDRGVEHLQMLGVRYYMAWTPEAQAKADANPNLRLVAKVPDYDNADPKGWNIYEVQDSALVQGLPYQPVVAKTHAGTTSQCFDTSPPGQGVHDPELGDWECSAAGWWTNRNDLDVAWTQTGPKSWKRVDAAKLADAPKHTLDPVKVTHIDEQTGEISFHVDKVGVPVVVKESYFPNWKVSGASGPYRLAPNLMVVVPTSHDVKLTYDLTPVDWLGRVLTLAGLVGLVLLARWKGARKYCAFPPGGARTGAGEADGPPRPGSGGTPDGDEPPPTEPPTPRSSEPAPALP